MRMFGRPRGALGRLGGVIMARSNAAIARSVISLLDVHPGDQVLEVGFGPGVGIQLLAKAAPAGRVAGVDCSKDMVEQARARNAEAIASGGVDLRHGSVESLPFEASTFDAVLAINSMQVWPDAMAGLRELRRVVRPGGRVALGFTPHSGSPRPGYRNRSQLPASSKHAWWRQSTASVPWRTSRDMAKEGPNVRSRRASDGKPSRRECRRRLGSRKLWPRAPEVQIRPNAPTTFWAFHCGRARCTRQ